jgi:hypothetical protein
MKLQKTQILPSVYEIKDKATQDWATKLIFFLDKIIHQIADIPFNQGDTLEVADTGLADTEFSLQHYSGRIPEGFILSYINISGVVYDSGTAWTKNTIYLKCSAANANVKLLIF